MKKPSIIRILIATAALTIAPLASAQSYVMQIANIDGSSGVAGYENWIDIESVTQSMFRDVSSGGGGGIGPLVVGDFVIVLRADSKALPALFGQMVNGDNPGEIVIEALTITPGGGPGSVAKTIRWEVEGNWSGLSTHAGSGDVPTSELTLTPTRIKILTYEDGSLVAEQEWEENTNP